MKSELLHHSRVVIFYLAQVFFPFLGYVDWILADAFSCSDPGLEPGCEFQKALVIFRILRFLIRTSSFPS
jgi:hypothetical protein